MWSKLVTASDIGHLQWSGYSRLIKSKILSTYIGFSRLAYSYILINGAPTLQ
jgi:hypothetical protein